MKYAIILFVLFLSACPKKAPVTEPLPSTPTPEKAPARIILMIGDGMGIGAVTAGTYAYGKPLQMTAPRDFAWITTHEYEYVTTDSAASATAFATGSKTHFNGISVVPGTTPEQENDPAYHLETWFETAKKRGLGTGLVSTSRVNHATPAAFVSHRSTRKSYDQIAVDIAEFGPDVLLGSGAKYFNKREDGRNLFKEMQERGWIKFSSAAGLENRGISKKIVGLFYDGDTPFLTDAKREVPLPDMFDVAVDVLDRAHPKGWVLMVEGSFIDWCAHSLDPKCLIAETLEFDEAVGRAYRYGETRDDTLVVVTADHETGGLTVIDPAYAERFTKVLGGPEATNKRAKIGGLKKPVETPDPVQHFDLKGPIRDSMPGVEDARFTTVFGDLSVGSAAHWVGAGRFYSAHTAEMVPLWAQGPFARWIASSRDNAEVGHRIKELVSLQTPDPVAEKPKQKSKNVILMIGDGMGISAVTATQYHHGNLAMTSLPIHGVVSTHAGDKLVADSAATATALSTATRSGRHRIGVDLNNNAVETIAETFAKGGKRVGIITDTDVAHATPAAFYAHTPSRKNTDAIIDGLITFPDRTEKPLDLIYGGGRKIFKKSQRDAAQKAGYAIVEAFPPPPESRNIIGLFADGALTPDSPSISEMTKDALQRLDNESGFLLVVEGGQIDWRLHEMKRGSEVLDGVRDFDDAVKIAKDFATKNGETTLIVTADHDHTLTVIDNHYAFESGRCGLAKRCGGPVEFNPLSVKMIDGFDQTELQTGFAPITIQLQYAWVVSAAMREEEGVSGPHSARFVPLFGYGPNSETFSGFLDQPDVGQRLFELLD